MSMMHVRERSVGAILEKKKKSFEKDWMLYTIIIPHSLYLYMITTGIIPTLLSTFLAYCLQT